MNNTKEIFRLRREEHTEEALLLARAYYEQNPGDPWAVKALGWVLYDMMKKAIDSDNQSDIDYYAQELKGLEIDPEDELLYNGIARLLGKQLPQNRDLAEAASLSFEGKQEDALKIFRQIRKDFSQTDTNFHNTYGWSLYKYLTGLIKNQAADKNTYQQLIDEYFGLTPETPSLLHSMMLTVALNHFKDNAPTLLQWQHQFKEEKLRAEDFLPYEKDGKKYPSLAEKAVQAMAKAMLAEGKPERINQFLLELNKAIGRYPDNIWLYYFKTKLLIKSGQKKLAKEFMIPVVRSKQTEYWAWALLADIVADESIDKAIACYCKALMCRTEEKYLINTRLSFGLLLHRAGFDNEARTEIAKSVQTRSESGYYIPANITGIIKEEWYQNAEPNPDNKAFYRANSSAAFAIVFGELPHYKGNFVSIFTRDDDPKKQLRARLLIAETDDNLVTLSVRVSLFPVLKHLKPGDAILVQTDQNAKQSVVSIELRETPEPFDMAKKITGVVDHINPEKMITHIALSASEGTNIYGKNEYKPGSFVELRILEQKRNGTTHFETLFHKPTTQMPSHRFCQLFSGRLALNTAKTSGRVGEVRIWKHLIDQYLLTRHEGKTISGLAVKAYNNKTQQHEWRAIMIDLVHR